MAKDQEFPDILSKQESVNIQKAEPGAEPSVPKPAATVLLVRAPSNKVEVFMIKRNAKTNFGGAWVFPGGKLDPVDEEIEINSFCSGLTDEMASQIINVEDGGLNYWIACIRECFEEVGILLAKRKSGEKLNLEGQICAEMMLQEDYRRSLHWKERRNAQLTMTPDCEFCSRPADVAHHNKYFGVLFMERLGIDLKSLCHNCHQTQHECINVISGNEIIEAERIKKVN